MLKSVLATITYVGIYLILFLSVIFLCRKGYHFCYEVFGSVAVAETPGEQHAFQVETADDLGTVSKKLEREGLIVNRYSFLARTKLMDSEETKLCPGVYLLNTDMDYEEIINQLTVSRGSEP